MNLLREDHLQNKREAAAERQAAYNKLSSKQKLEHLDNLLGEGKGATKERARIQHRIDNPPKPKPAPKPEVAAEEKPKQPAKKFNKKRRRRPPQDGTVYKR